MALNDEVRRFFSHFQVVLTDPSIGLRAKAGYMAAVSSMDDNRASSPYPSHIPLKDLVVVLQRDIEEWLVEAARKE